MSSNPITDLVQVVQSSGLELQTANYIQEKFAPFFEQAKEWKEKADALVITDVSQKTEMKMAREARLALRQIRLSAEKVRKTLKEDSLKYGRTVDGVYNVIESAIAPIEKHLENQEKFEEIQKAKLKAELKAARQAVLQPYFEFVPYGVDFAELEEAEFQKLVHGAKLQKEFSEQQKKREAEERAAAAERQKQERERLEKERLETQKKLEKERKEKEAAQAKLAEELKRKKEADEKAAAELKAKKAAERKLAAAPDKEKVLHFIKQVASLSPIGKLKTNEAIQMLGDFTNALSELQQKAESL